MSLQPVMTFDFYNSTVTWCPDPALNLSWVTNATAVPELEDWSTPSSSNRRRHHPHLLMVWWQQLVWSALFALMLLVATGGNAIVLWIVLAHRRMRTITNYFLVNLSVADLFMAVFNCVFNFVYMLNSNWYFGSPYCRISNFIANVSVAASVFTLTGISFDRYLAIVRPLQPRMSKASAQVTILVIWLAGMVLGLPCLLYSTTITYKYSGKIRTACILVWPDGQPLISTLDYVYNVVLLLATYVAPMAAMVACYSAMGRELWGSRSIGELTQRQVDSIRSKRKVVRMFIIIVSIFAVCWLPYHAYFIYTHHNRSLAYSRYVQHLYLGFYWLAMSNTMVNPLIYYWMNARFRRYFKQAVCEWHCTCRKTPVNLNRLETARVCRRYSPPSGFKSKSGTAEECVLNGRKNTVTSQPCHCSDRHQHARTHPQVQYRQNYGCNSCCSGTTVTLPLHRCRSNLSTRKFVTIAEL
ncbi:tachykinin-like peptides receptor 86C isoform X2 [Cryptotermes secundus]|nr:tachykinin-like peptides receptor 86C isoform X2 [Cryptotermes secundus]